MTKRLSMGVPDIDDHLDGGPRPGTLACLTAPPASQAGTLSYAMMQERPTLYITTLRDETAVRDEFGNVFDDTEYTIESVSTQKPLRSVNRAIKRAGSWSGQRQNIIIDTMNPLERTNEYDRYTDLLNAIKSYLLEVRGVALLQCTALGQAPALREVTLTIADLVMDLEITSKKSTIENRLTVPKFRSHEGVDEVIKLKLGQEALVDTSRNL